MKIGIKAKGEAPAPRHQATGLLKPNLDEIRNGYSAEKLTETMRAGCDSDYEFCLLRLVRAADRKNRATVALAEFSRAAYPRDQKFKATLARLQQEEEAAAAELSLAEALRDAAEAA